VAVSLVSSLVSAVGSACRSPLREFDIDEGPATPVPKAGFIHTKTKAQNRVSPVGSGSIYTTDTSNRIPPDSQEPPKSDPLSSRTNLCAVQLVFATREENQKEREAQEDTDITPYSPAFGS
jgi:hypothetical protein